MTNVVDGGFGKTSEAPAASDTVELFLENVTAPAEAEGQKVEVVCIQLDDFGVSLGSNSTSAGDVVLMLEMAKLSVIEQFLGGDDHGTVH